MKGKKIVSYALATIMTMQGGGLVFAGENTANNLASRFSAESKYNNQYTQFLNSIIANGYLKVDSNNKLSVTQKYVDRVQNNLKSANLKEINKETAVVYADKNAIVIKDSSNENEGETKFVFTWKGFDIYLDHRICNSIVKAEDATVAISGIITLIAPEAAPIAGIIDAMLEIGKFVFESQDLGRGVIMAFIEPCILHWISSQ